MRTCLYGHLITPPLITSLHFQRDIIGNSALKNITRFWLAENECILMWHECKVVTRVQSWNTNKLQTACFQNFVCFSKTTNCTRPAGSCTFCLWKICSCLFTPNSIRNHLITYTYCILDLTVLDELILCSELMTAPPNHPSSLPPPPSSPNLLPLPPPSSPYPLPPLLKEYCSSALNISWSKRNSKAMWKKKSMEERDELRRSTSRGKGNHVLK